MTTLVIIQENKMKYELLALDKHCKAWIEILGSISHALVTKLATLRMKQKSLKEILPELVHGYHLAIEHKLINEKISDEDLKSLNDTVDLEEQILPMMNLLESVNTYGNEMRSDSFVLSAREGIHELLAKYPYKNEVQKKLVTFEDGPDFNIHCPPIFINALLLNLLSNGLKGIEKVGDGTISIWISANDESSSLNFKVRGQGMNERSCSRIFTQVISQLDEKEIPGLGLCRLAIQHVGGDVDCEAVQGEYKHFKLIFPNKN